MMEEETGVMQRQAKGCQGLPAVARSQEKNAWNRFSLRATRRNQHCQPLDFGLLTSSTVREYISVFSKPPR